MGDLFQHPAKAVLGVLFVLYFASRTFDLTGLPLFVDESKHLWWSKRLRTEPGFLKPMEDGKLLQVVVDAAVTPWASDPVWAGRFASVLAGALGAWAAWRIGRRVYDEPSGLVAAGLYVVCPFALVYDRMNLADVYLSSFAALALLATLRLVERPSPGEGVRLGLALAASVLSKVPGLLVFAVPLAGAALLRPAAPGLVRALGTAYAVAACLVAFPVGYFLATTSQIAAKGAAAPSDRVSLVLENARLAGGWLWTYWTPPIALVGLAAIALAALRRHRAGLVLGIAALLPVATFVAGASQWFPRYVLFATVPVLVLSAGLLREAAEVMARRGGGGRWVAVAAGALLLAPALRFDVLVLADPRRAPWPRADRFQFVEGWPSGYGWKEAHRVLSQERARGTGIVRVMTDTRGHATGHWALRAYFLDDAGVEIVTLDLGGRRARHTLERWMRRGEAYVVTSAKTRRRFSGTAAYRVIRIAALTKPGGRYAGNVYRLTPRQEGPAEGRAP